MQSSGKGKGQCLKSNALLDLSSGCTRGPAQLVLFSHKHMILQHHTRPTVYASLGAQELGIWCPALQQPQQLDDLVHLCKTEEASMACMLLQQDHVCVLQMVATIVQVYIFRDFEVSDLPQRSSLGSPST